MKTRSKALLMALCAVLLVCSTIFGTLAYLTSTDAVTNTFTVGQVKITLDEAKVTEDGKPVADAGRVQSNKYHLLPGQTYTKDPTIHIDSKSEESYIYVKLEIVDNADLVIALQKYGLSDQVWDLLNGSVEADWTALGVTEEGGSKTYLLAYKKTVKGGADIKLFESITVPGEFTNADMESIEDLKINVTAYAVQAAGFETAAEAWDAAKLS